MDESLSKIESLKKSNQVGIPMSTFNGSGPIIEAMEKVDKKNTKLQWAILTISILALIATILSISKQGESESQIKNRQIQYDAYRQKYFECLGSINNTTDKITNDQYIKFQEECYREFDVRMRSTTGLFVE